jgi:uncharacterized membrane protein YgcG
LLKRAERTTKSGVLGWRIAGSRRLAVAFVAGVAVASSFVGGQASGAASVDTLTITPPADIAVTADSVCGQSNCAQVSYTFTVTGGYTPYNLVCNLPSGGMFLVGVHTVFCLAQDSKGNSTGNASFTLTVNPGGPPPPPPPPPPPMLSISAPPDMTVPTTTVCVSTPCGPASYSFTVTGGYPPYSQICNLPSGGMFLVGVHTIQCMAHDSVGNATGYASFTLTVTPPVSTSGGGGSGGGGGSSGGGGGSGSGGTGAASGSGGGAISQAPPDTTAPKILDHAAITVAATGPAGAVVVYTVRASDPDNSPSQLTISCTPASSSTFPLGHRASNRHTTVTCTARDPAGNGSEAGSFLVTVLGAHSQIQALIRAVSTSRNLTATQIEPLFALLLRADRDLSVGHTSAAKTQLRKFVGLLAKRRPTRSSATIAAAKRVLRILG